MRTAAAFFVCVGAALLAILLASSSPHAQPVTSGQGLSRVVHDRSLMGSGTSSNPLGVRTDCTSTQILKWNGTSWACAADSAGTGDITDVTVTSPACSAGSYMTTLTGGASSGNAPVGGTCTAEVGDISSVGATANMGLTGGATSGAATLGLLSTCANGEVLKSGGTGTTWTCAADSTGTGESTVAGAGLTLTGSTVDAVCLTGLTCNANDIQIAARDFGDVTTTSAGSVWDIDASAVGTSEIADGSVALADMANMATASFIGRTTAATGVPEVLTATQATAILNAATATLKGLVPTPPNNTTTFLRGDATFAAVPAEISGLTTNTIPKATSSTAIGNSSVTDTGTVVDVNTALSKFGSGSDGYVYLAELSMGFGFAVDADLTGYISNTGYNNSTTRFRSLEIQDGKSAAIATFTGSSKLVALAGALTVATNLTTGGYAEIANAVYANSQSVYTSSGGINAFRTTNAAATLLINPVGYLDGTTQFRSTSIQDGKGSPIVLLDGADKHIYYYGTAPTLSGCTGNCTIAAYSTDTRGKVSCTDGPNACTVTFATGFTTNAPSCVFGTTRTTTVYQTTAPATGSMTFTTQGAGAHSVDYHCDGML